MKKSLSLLLAFAMVFSMFSSLAFAADTELTTQQKYDALAAKGIFAGIDGKAALDENMNRAQFARVAALILGLEGIGATDTKVVTEKPFSDVELGLWYTEEIAAAKEAGVFVGNADGTFNPKGNITVQELAVVVTGLLGLEKVEDATVEGAADWAAGYIQAIINAGVDFPTNYTQPATRADLASLAYTADAKINPTVPAKVSVASAKAVGIQKIEVVLDKAVDATKATLTVKKGTATLTSKAAFNADNKTAIVTLSDAKISAGDYSVTLGGLEEDAIANATANFTAEAETVTTVEFVSASDTIAYSKNASLKVKASNQYGEPSSHGAGSFSAFVLGTQISPTKDEEGYLVLKFNITNGGTTPLGTGLVQGNGQVPITVYYNDTRVNAFKTFKLGTQPFLTKVELGEVQYPNKGTSLVAKDEVATIPLHLFDQYGNPVIFDQMDGALPEVSPTTINALVTPYSPNLVYDNTQLFDSNGNAQAVIKLTNKEEKSSEYNVTVYAGSSSATTKLSVGAGKLATKVEFGSFSGAVAAGDTAKDFYIPIVAHDSEGNQLSAQDIADNAKLNRFTFSGTNVAGTPAIEQYGEKKGQLKFNISATASARSSVYLTALIATAGANSYNQTNIAVQEQRHPDRIVVKDEPAAKAILGASSDFKFLVKDQYGEDFALGTAIPDANGVVYDYQVVVTISGDTATSGISLVDKVSPGTTTYNDGSKTHTYTSAQLADFNGGFTFNTTPGQLGKVTVKAVIQRQTGVAAFNDYSTSISRTIEAIKPDADLTYKVKDLGATYAYIDKKPGGIAGTDIWTGLVVDTAPTSFFDKKLEVEAFDSAGNKVAIPDNAIRGITTTDESIAKVQYDGGNDAYVLGNKAGTATVTAIVYTNKGTSVALSKEITVKADTIQVDSIKGDKTAVTYAGENNVFALFNNLIVKDQYGVEYKGNTATNPIITYEAILGIRYSITSVDGGTVTLDAKTGILSTAGAVKEFVVTATAPNGKSASVLVKMP